MSPQWTEEELAEKMKENPDLKVALPGPWWVMSELMKTAVSSKYKARRTEYANFNYDSKKEADFAAELSLKQKAKAINYWLRQVPFRLPGGIVYRVDFQVFYPNGEVRYFDVKGFDTALSRTKRKMVEALYPVSIEVER